MSSESRSVLRLAQFASFVATYGNSAQVYLSAWHAKQHVSGVQWFSVSSGVIRMRWNLHSQLRHSCLRPPADSTLAPRLAPRWGQALIILPYVTLSFAAKPSQREVM